VSNFFNFKVKKEVLAFESVWIVKSCFAYEVYFYTFKLISSEPLLPFTLLGEQCQHSYLLVIQISLEKYQGVVYLVTGRDEEGYKIKTTLEQILTIEEDMHPTEQYGPAFIKKNENSRLYQAQIFRSCINSIKENA
jgi:hypothetical protein